MKLPFELVLIASSTLAFPLTPRSATLPQLNGLTSNTRDLSTTDARFPSKYFHESVYHPHYDGRFATAIQPRSARMLHMRLLLRSYMAAMNRAGVRTWLMHGSLLGWWWNRKVFPWDSDLDVCVEEAGMEELGGWWNMTVHDFTGEELGLEDPSKAEIHSFGRRRRGTHQTTLGPEAHDRIHEPSGLDPGVWDKILQHGKKYLLEVNPYYTTASTSDPHNRIDARWIDTSTGLFIDITTTHPVPRSATAKSAVKHKIFLEADDESSSSASTPSNTEDGDGTRRPEEMYTKDTHLYDTASLFPLRQSRFEGADVWVPYAYEQLLLEEYGPRALVETWFYGYQFDKATREWVVAPEPEVRGGGKGKGEGKQDGKKVEDTPVDDKERNAKDNQGEEVYVPSPGKVGDVHVVPGSR